MINDMHEQSYQAERAFASSRSLGTRSAQVGPSLQSFLKRADLLTLKLFLSAIEEGQIGRAAERENLVPSAATRRIQELEDLAGTRLLDRSAKGVVASPAGQVVARHARMVIDALLGMRRDVVAFTHGNADTLSIAAPRLLIIYFVAAQLGEFERRYPDFEVDLREETYPDTLRALITGDVELAVFDTPVSESRIEGVDSLECRRDRLVVLVPVNHPLASARSVSLETLLEQELIGTRPASCLMSTLRHAAGRIGHELRLKRSVETLDAARSMVSAGLGVALHPQSGILSLHQREHLVTLPIDGDWATLSYRVGWREGRSLTPAAAALVEQLTARLAFSRHGGCHGAHSVERASAVCS